MKEKLIKQIIMVLLLAAALFLADHSHIGVLERGSAVIQSQMAAEYTWSDVKHAGQKAAAAASALPDKVNETVQIVTGAPNVKDGGTHARRSHR